MNDKKVLEETFSEFATGDNINIKETGRNFEYSLKTNFKMTVIINYETEANLFSVDIQYPNRDSYSLSSFDIYKDFDKKRTKKKMFGKKTFTDHLISMAQFLHENLGVLYEEDTARVFFSNKVRGYNKIFVE